MGGKTVNTPSNQPLTPGQQYVADFLPHAEWGLAEWVGRNVDAGRLLVCPRCHFARLPKNPFSIDANMKKRYPDVTEDTCEVCALLADAAQFLTVPHDIGPAVRNAPAALVSARLDRVQSLYDYWISACDAADAFVWAAMRTGLDAVGIVPAPTEGGRS